ncbi:hypothetical protein ACFL59_16125 [Planctomycetota bacterium]
MTVSEEFLHRVLAARRAAWQVFLVGVALQIVTYFGYLAIDAGWLESFVESGLYGSMPQEELARATFMFVAVLKLMNIGLLFAALFLTLWARGLRKD